MSDRPEHLLVAADPVDVVERGRLRRCDLRVLALPRSSVAPAMDDAWGVALQAAAGMIANAATELLSTPASWTLTPVDSNAATVSAAWHVLLRSDDGATLSVELDAAACRALLTPLMEDYAPLPADAVDEVESGLLDYLALGVARRLGPRADDRWSIEAMHAGPRAVDEPSPRVAGLRVRVGLLNGRALVRVPGDALPPVFDVVSDELTTPLDVRLALPAMSMSAIERDALAAGDCVMLSISTLVGVEADVLVGAGRYAGRALIEASTADRLSVRLTMLGVRPMAREACVVTVGGVGRSLDALARWTAGETTIDVSLSDALLWLDGRPRWAGELLTVDGELALRLLREVDA